MNALYSGIYSVYKLIPYSMRERIQKNRMLKQLKSSGQRLLLGHHQYVYNPTYYACVDSDAMRSRDAMADSIVTDLKPKTLVDIGCGTGALLEAICMRGVQGVGMEYSDAGRAMCEKRRLNVRKFNILTDTPPNDIKNQDVAISFEVAEHLPESGADRFVELLCSLANVVVCSAATPGQGGADHLNEQPHDYWIARFRARSFEYDAAQTEAWQATWRNKSVARFYSANVMIFRKNS